MVLGSGPDLRRRQGRFARLWRGATGTLARLLTPTYASLLHAQKVLDACALNERFWVFAAGLTNVDVLITVTDTHTGTNWSSHNDLDEAFAPIQDTETFAVCPH